jgi:hypothetical protein
MLILIHEIHKQKFFQIAKTHIFPLNPKLFPAISLIPNKKTRNPIKDKN